MGVGQYRRSRTSPYLLSGGTFTCDRCGHNMRGIRREQGRLYYVCGSQPYRSGLGCGPGVYVPKNLVEQEALAGLHDVLAACSDPGGFTRKVNDHIRQAWEKETGYDPLAAERLRGLDTKIANVRRALEDGLHDASWANERLEELRRERDLLTTGATQAGPPPTIDADRAIRYREDLEGILAHGELAEKKQILRAWVAEMKLAPERLQVKITYRIPEPVVPSVVAGAGFEQHLPFAAEVTVALPSLRGVREHQIVPMALEGMYYVRAGVSAWTGTSSPTI